MPDWVGVDQAMVLAPETEDEAQIEAWLGQLGERMRLVVEERGMTG